MNSLTACKVFFASLFVVSIAGAQFPTAGTASYQHLLLNYDARTAALGGANCAIPGTHQLAVSNPAILGTVKKQEYGATGQKLIDDVWGTSISLARPLFNGIWSFALQGLSSGEVRVIEEATNGDPYYTGDVAKVEYFTPTLSYGKLYLDGRLTAGVSVKGMYQRIVYPPEIYSSKAIGFDAGIQYRPYNDRLIVGCVLRNIGWEFSPSTDDEAYATPSTIEAGVSFIPRYLDNVRIALDVNKIKGEYINFEPGIELEVYPKILMVRLGYPFSQRDARQLYNKLSGKETDGYVKTNWSTLACGIGLTKKVQEMQFGFDFGVQLRERALPPATIFSALVQF